MTLHLEDLPKPKGQPFKYVKLIDKINQYLKGARLVNQDKESPRYLQQYQIAEISTLAGRAGICTVFYQGAQLPELIPFSKILQDGVLSIPSQSTKNKRFKESQLAEKTQCSQDDRPDCDQSRVRLDGDETPHFQH